MTQWAAIISCFRGLDVPRPFLPVPRGERYKKACTQPPSKISYLPPSPSRHNPFCKTLLDIHAMTNPIEIDTRDTPIQSVTVFTEDSNVAEVLRKFTAEVKVCHCDVYTLP